MKTLMLFLAFLTVCPARAAIRIVSGRDDEGGAERPQALEFTDAKGGLLKRIALAPGGAEDMLGARDAFDARLSASGNILALTHWHRDPWQRNPYLLRRSQSTTVLWYGQDGALLGQRDFPARTQVMALSPDGGLTVLVDLGFSRGDFAVFNDVPSLRSTEELARDRELIDHKIYAVRPTGEVVLTRTIQGPEVPPQHVEVSPSGRWFLYKLDRPDVYVDDAATGKEDRYVHALPLNWRVNDQGELYGYEPQKGGGLLLYVRKPGAVQAVPVETASAREP
jgi:hypothetical protein